MTGDRRDEETTLPAVVNDLRLAAYAGRIAEKAAAGLRQLAAEKSVMALHGVPIDHFALSRRMHATADVLEETMRELRDIGRRLEAEGATRKPPPLKS